MEHMLILRVVLCAGLDYNRASGRSSLEKFLLGKVRDRLREEFQGYLTLLKYWRDQAGHGAASNIRDNEAYTSLALLLRFSLFVDQWWDELIADSQQPH
jgi:hypothetical protein